MVWFTRSVGALVAIVALFVLGIGAASAQSYPPPTPTPTPTSDGPTVEISCSLSAGQQGATVTCVLSGFLPNSTVAVEVQGGVQFCVDGVAQAPGPYQDAFTEPVGADGTVEITYEFPDGAVGDYTVTVDGVDENAQPVTMSDTITMDAAPGCQATPGGSDGGVVNPGVLGNTGADVALLVGIVAVLLLAGGALLLAARRRNAGD